MTKRMLIDGVHPEQTRVVVMDDRKLLEFDTEIASQRTLKGNIYLAKITRVEPSLQAAFVDYGGNRHGFLPFSEIHADYYRIPVADREALKASQRQRGGRDDDLDDDEAGPVDTDGDDGDPDEGVLVEAGNAGYDLDGDEEPAASEGDDDRHGAPSQEETQSGDSEEDNAGSGDGPANSVPLAAENQDPSVSLEPSGDADESVDAGGSAEADGDGNEDASDDGSNSGRSQNRRGRRNGRSSGRDRDDERRRAPRPQRRAYTIQEVIKRGQIMLIQVVKEERGTKGAAVTTYLSLAGRYCVLMPNTARGGGISRKITNGKDRSRLKEIVDSLEIQDSMAVIVRTAGIGRTKAEIKRDYDFLAKTWERVRDDTLRSRAPVLINEESGLIKRTLRDSYTREIEEVIVQGDAAYREAKDFMKTLMPSHAKRVQPYKDASPPLFHRFNVDAQLHRLHSPIVQLPSGGYLVINMTEALVAIDINSGRSTRERHIEETAIKTNLEAADEIGRQLRLRDLAGLIVIDFIDMEDRRNNFAVERRLKEAMRTDRARVQIGRISSLGLLELSRQRLRPSLLETNMDLCPVCAGLGRVSSTSSSALQVLSTIEDEGMRRRAGLIRVHVAAAVAFYVLNEKREELARIERDYGLRCIFEPDETLLPPNLRIEVLEGPQAPVIDAPQAEIFEDDVDEVDIEEEVEEVAPRRRGRRVEEEASEESDEQDSSRRRRGRRSNRRRRDEAEVEENTAKTEQPVPDESSADQDSDDGADTDRSRNRRRRRRRRGRGEARAPLPGVAVFSRSATPLAWHVALENTPAQSGDEDSQPQDDQEQDSFNEEASPVQPVEIQSSDEASVDAPAEVVEASAASDTEVSEKGDTVAAMLMPVAQAMDKAPGSGRTRRRRRSSARETAANEPAGSIAEETVEGNAVAADAAAQPEAQAEVTIAEAVEETRAESAGEPQAEAVPEPVEAAPEPVEEAPAADEMVEAEEEAPAMAEAAPEPEAPRPDRPRRRGWWQRLLD